MLESKEKQTEKLTIVSVELPISFDDVKEFRDTGVIVSIKPPKKCRKNKQSINLELKAPIRKGDISLLNYICDALITYNSKLIPFVWNNESVRRLARHYHIHKTSSVKTLRSAVFFLNLFSEFTEMQPDDIVRSLIDSDGNTITKAVKRLKEDIEEWQAELKAMEYAPNSIKQGVTSVKSWLQINEIEIGRISTPKSYTKYPDRAPTPEELQRMIDVANLHEKVIVSILALSGLRVGTLAKLKYKHVKDDLETGRIPLCIHIDAEITKGKYADYYTFIGKEAVEYLKLYIKARREGTLRRYVPPEEISDESPLIVDMKSKEVKGTNGNAITCLVHRLIRKAGIISKEGRKVNELRAHSLRKYFKTQLTAKGVSTDYVEFMMGHVISTYQDVKSLGIDFLREVYRRSGISIRPQTKATKLEMLKEFIRSIGEDPEKLLVKDALLEPKRTVINEDREVEVLQEALRDWIKKIATQGDR